MSLIDRLRMKNYVDKKITPRNIPVLTPSSFDWNHPLKGKIFTDGKGSFETTLNMSDFMTKDDSKQIYHVSKDGNDSNDGLTRETALRNLTTALSKPDVGTIFIYEGVYTRSESFNAVSITGIDTLNLIGVGHVVLSTHDNLSWTKTSGKENVYQTNRSLVGNVVDVKVQNEYGDHTPLKLVDDIDTVELTEGSYFTDDAVLYVHPYGLRPADENIRAYLNVYNLNSSNANSLYIANINFEGGSYPIRVTNSPTFPNATLYVSNCSFKYGINSNGVTLQGMTSVFYKCVTSSNPSDGFNYHGRNDVAPKAIEIDCLSYNNGTEGRASDNASSIHGGGKIVRVNGQYFSTHGPVIADVDEGTQSWNMGCVSFNSLPDHATQNASFQIATGNAQAWYDSCIGYGSTNSLVVGGTNVIAYLRNNHFDNEIIGTGTRESY